MGEEARRRGGPPDNGPDTHIVAHERLFEADQYGSQDIISTCTFLSHDEDVTSSAFHLQNRDGSP
jgi:hypothetical protein